MTVPFPFALRPMLLEQRREPFDGAGWLSRAGRLAGAGDDAGRPAVDLEPRNGRDLTKAFHGVAQALSGLPSGTALDSELVVLDGKGRP